MDARLRRLAAVALLASMGVVAGCGSAVRTAQVAPKPVAVAPTAPIAVAPTPQPLAPDFVDVFGPPLPETKLPGAELCAVREGEACPVPAGRNHSTLFATDVVFTVRGTGWTNVVNAFDAVSLENGSSAFTITSEAPRLWYYAPRPQTPSDPNGDWENLAWRGTNFGFTVGPLRDDAQIDGHSVRRFDIVNDSDEQQWILSTEGMRLGCWCVGGSYTLEPGTSARLLFLEVEGDGVVIVLEAPTPEFDAYLRSMRPVLASIDFVEAAQ